MIRDLIKRAQQDENIAWGECFVVHLGPGGEINPMRPTAVSTFLREWRDIPGVQAASRAIGAGRSVRSRWLGVVHDDGLFVVPVATKDTQPETDPADWWKHN